MIIFANIQSDRVVKILYVTKNCIVGEAKLLHSILMADQWQMSTRCISVDNSPKLLYIYFFHLTSYILKNIHVLMKTSHTDPQFITGKYVHNIFVQKTTKINTTGTTVTSISQGQNSNTRVSRNNDSH